MIQKQASQFKQFPAPAMSEFYGLTAGIRASPPRRKGRAAQADTPCWKKAQRPTARPQPQIFLELLAWGNGWVPAASGAESPGNLGYLDGFHAARYLRFPYGKKRSFSSWGRAWMADEINKINPDQPVQETPRAPVKKASPEATDRLRTQFRDITTAWQNTQSAVPPKGAQSVLPVAKPALARISHRTRYIGAANQRK